MIVLAKPLITQKKDALQRLLWVTSGARTHDTRNHNPMLCQLSYSHRVRSLSKAGAKVLLFFDMTKYFTKKMSRFLLLLIFYLFFWSYFRWKLIRICANFFFYSAPCFF